MNGHQAIEKLVKWCKKSEGIPIVISPGKEYFFRSIEHYSEESIAKFEAELNWKLPETYRLLLLRLGHCQLFIDEFDLGLEIYGPAQALAESSCIWEGEEEVTGDKFCLVGSNSGTGDFFGFVINRPGPNNFDIFCHEYPPFAYVTTSDELQSWRTLDTWLEQIVETFGEDCL